MSSCFGVLRAPDQVVDKTRGRESSATPTADPPCLATDPVEDAELRHAGGPAAPVFEPGAAVMVEWFLRRGETY